MNRKLPSWAPLAGFKKQAEEVRRAVDEMMNLPFEQVRQQMVSAANDFTKMMTDYAPERWYRPTIVHCKDA